MYSHALGEYGLSKDDAGIQTRESLGSTYLPRQVGRYIFHYNVDHWMVQILNHPEMRRRARA